MRSAAVIIVPIMLVAAKVIPKRTTDARIVPRIPVSRTGTVRHMQHRMPVTRKMVDAISSTARYTTAIPKRTHRKAGVTVITAVIARKPVITPIIRLAITARPVQLVLRPQL